MISKGIILEKAEYEPVPVLERAKEAMNAKSDYELAQKLDVTTATMSGYRKRKSLPLEQCIKVSKSADISLDWLILGKGGKYDPCISTDNVLIPLYDTPASAGHGSFFDSENIIRHVPFDAVWLKREGLYPRNLACLPIKGDSMMPGLIDGDIVLIDRARTRGDGVFVLRIGDALRIKRVQWLANGSLRISSDNPLYQPEILNPAELDDTQFAIIGACHTKIGRVS